MLFVSVDSAERLVHSKQKTLFPCFLFQPGKDERCPIDLDKSGFRFQRQQSLFERLLNHV